MRIGLVSIVSALIVVLPCAADAIPVTAIPQSNAPVQIASCSASAIATSSVPAYGQFSTNTLRDSSGKIDYAGPPISVDQHIPMTAMPDGTRVTGTAEAAIRSKKTVTGVVYQFDVLDKNQGHLAVSYGPAYGPDFTAPWSVQVTRSDVASVTCLVAYVRFSDGTFWQSPLATLRDERSTRH